MIDTPEGISSRKWAFEPTEEGLFLNEGKHRLAKVEKDGEAVKTLLVTAPQLWSAANELIYAIRQNKGDQTALLNDLADMVAKSVGKQDWTKVLQS